MTEGEIIPSVEWLHVAVDPKAIIGDYVAPEAVRIPAQSCTRSHPDFLPDACLDSRRPAKTAIARIKPELFPTELVRHDGKKFIFIATHRPNPSPTRPNDSVHPAHSEIRLHEVGQEFRNSVGNDEFMLMAGRELGSRMRIVHVGQPAVPDPGLAERPSTL